MKLKVSQFILLCLFAFAGGFLGEVFAGSQGGARAQENGATPPVIFYGEDGQPRLQMGLSTEPAEKGLPLISLSDNAGRLRLLLRLAGDAQAPLLVMRDQGGRDRVILGLAMEEGVETPYLSVIDASGKSRDIVRSQ